MSLYGAFDKTKHLGELADPLFDSGGHAAFTPNERVAAVLANLGLAGGAVLDASVEVADDVLPIPVTARVVLKETGGDAEALTLADGFPGQLLTIVLAIDGGGDGTISPTTATGWDDLVLADEGDTVTLLYVDDTEGWVIQGSADAAGTGGPAYTAP